VVFSKFVLVNRVDDAFIKASPARYEKFNKWVDRIFPDQKQERHLYLHGLKKCVCKFLRKKRRIWHSNGGVYSSFVLFEIRALAGLLALSGIQEITNCEGIQVRG
jgi:hypothetical protein